MTREELRGLADRLRWIDQQHRGISLQLAEEVCKKLPDIVKGLDLALAQCAPLQEQEFQVLPGEDGNFALGQLQSALNDIDISAYNAAKWRIGKAIAVLSSTLSSTDRGGSDV